MVKDIKNFDKDDYITPIFASRAIIEPIAKNKLNEKSIPEDIVYNLIKEELDLDANPSQNLASFVTTWVEEKAQKLVSDSIKYNLADEVEYPHIIEIQKRCLNILANLFNAPKNVCIAGTNTIGSSEAVMLAGLALKWKWKNRTKDSSNPNIIIGSNTHVVWKKFIRYFDVEPKIIDIDSNSFVVSKDKVIENVDSNTIGVCLTLGTTFTGEFEPVEEISNALDDLYKNNGLDVPIHVDAASGGFIAPFLYPDIKWDFRLQRVVSINVSGHKYGLAYPGIGWVLWRNKDYLPEELIFPLDYLGGQIETFTLNFSRASYGVVSQYYNFLRLGNEGYKRIFDNLKSVTGFIYGEIDNLYIPDKNTKEQIKIFEIQSKLDALPVVVWSANKSLNFNVYELSQKLREFGWVVPAYELPPNANNITVLRVVVKENFNIDLAEHFINDLKTAVNNLQSRESFTLNKNKTHPVC